MPFSAFQWVFTFPHPINGFGDMTFCKTMGLLKIAFLGRLQHPRKIKIWGYLGGILPLS
jgi:hypothetical protein